jgi:hypothetical protein
MSIMANDIVGFLRENGVEPQLAEGQTYVANARPAAPPATPPKPPGGRERPWIERFLGSGDDRTRDAGSFTVRVPNGWSVLDEEEDMILLGADDDSAAVGILVSGNRDMSLGEVAQAYADEFGALEPDYDDEDDVYSFTFEDEGVETVAIVAGDEGEGRHAMLFISGDASTAGVEEILDSLEDK